MKTPLLAAVALATVAAPAVARQTEGLVRLRQAAYVGGPRVTPLKVIEDSRCPMNARCVWAGRVIVRAKVQTGRSARTMDLTLGQPVRVADGMLALTSVTPEKMAGAQPRRTPYRFGFSFEGGL
ncbi:hypothetical protein ABC347_05170 [Sphingomonas sp. 1P06PA]|uniref:hypothetical protein n=1 Tax=Sphingomonas sp. 1P06PA TaxID=554121 RepID=UPI0039A59614